MKRVGLLFFLCLFLSGCGSSKNPSSEPSQHPQLYPTDGIYLSDSTLERTTSGALRQYNFSTDSRFFCIGNDIIAADYSGSTLVLSKLTGNSLIPDPSCSFSLPWKASLDCVRTEYDSIAIVSPSTGQYLVLNSCLKELQRIAIPSDCRTPILSTDRKTLYFCQDHSVFSREVETGMVRTVKEFPDKIPQIESLCLNDSLLCCTFINESFSTFLSAVDGHEITQLSNCISTLSSSNRLCISCSLSPLETVLFGSSLNTLQELTLPIGSQVLTYLEKQNAVAVCRSENGIILELYDLNTGKCTSVLNSTFLTMPVQAAASGSGYVYFVCYDPESATNTLIRWDPEMSRLQTDTVFSGPRYTPESPDQNALTECRKEIELTERTYPLKIHIYQEAVSKEPFDYSFSTEYRGALIQNSLKTIVQCLADFPLDFWQSIAEKNISLHICLVQEISSKSGSNSPELKYGLLYNRKNDWYIAIVPGQDLESCLHHMLAHLIDTIVINHSRHFDNWDELNPKGFSYCYAYNVLLKPETFWITDQNRYFVDSYSTSFPVEDRARLLEYAMNEGNDTLFQSEQMQEKLRQYCIAIRKNFNLTKYREIFRWEQYLWHSLSYRS